MKHKIPKRGKKKIKIYLLLKFYLRLILVVRRVGLGGYFRFQINFGILY